MHLRVVLDNLGDERRASAAYVFRTLLGTLGLPHGIAAEPQDTQDGAVLWYGQAAPPATHAAAVIECACLEPPTPASPITWITCVGDARRIAVLGGHQPVRGRPLYHAESDGQPVVAIEGSHVRVGVDLIASAGFWLTGGDETPERRDPFGRTHGATGPRHEAGLTATPVATDLMRLLGECIRRAASAAGRPLARVGAWPAGKSFALLLSHDIDFWRKRTLRQFAKELVRTVRHPLRLGAVARAFCGGPDPWDLEPIADVEERRGMRSTFFLLAGRPDRDIDGLHVVNGYTVAPETVRRKLRRLIERGWEVGLHGSFDSFRSAESLDGERRDLEALAGHPVTSTRQHFLRFELPATWRCQVEAGLRCDATLGYHDREGYRAGFSFPFHPFDGREQPLLALPLVVMDGALFERQGLDAAAAWRRVQGHLERALADRSMLSLLWHNTHFCELDAPGYGAVYERALDWARGRGGWGASARDVAEWWEKRSAVSLEEQPQAEAVRIGIAAPGGLAEVPVELHGAWQPTFEACRGRILEQGDGLVRCAVGELVAGESAILLRKA